MNNDEWHAYVKESFENMEPFKTSDDIPEVPKVAYPDFYKDVIVKNLIRCGAIPKSHLIVGETYYGSCRNAEYAKWNGEEFVYKRYKFGSFYKDLVNHFEDDDGFDLFVPIKLIRK